MCDQLSADGTDFVTLGRTRSERGAGIVGDLAEPEKLNIHGKFDILVHMAPLWLLPNNLEKIVNTGVQRVIAFSSTSIETKQASKQELDQVLVRTLSAAEALSAQIAQACDTGLTLFRPTMIYGFGRDKNITTIANIIRRFGFFPIAGSGSGLRQPVHALDLVEACVQCMDNDTTIGKIYNLGGGERLSYKHMVDRIFSGLRLKPRTIHFSITIYKALLAIALKLKVMKGVSIEAAGRMNENFCFDNGPARSDFGYSGSLFLDNPARDLPPEEGGH